MPNALASEAGTLWDSDFPRETQWPNTPVSSSSTFFFATDGRFLGELEVPREVNLRFALPWVSGDTVIANYYDESGVIMVKRYRLVPPDPGS